MVIPVLPDPNSRDWYAWAAGVDEAAREVGDRLFYRGAWAATTDYEQGDCVTQNNALYAAIADFTSGATFNPDRWAQIGVVSLPSPPGDASATAKGLVQLAGELGGSAAIPLVVGRLGASVKQVSGTDWNNVVETGWYAGERMANSPNGGVDWHYVTVQRLNADSSYLTQTAVWLIDGNARIYTRNRFNFVWGSWTRLTTLADKPVIQRGSIGNTTSWEFLVTPGVYQFNGGSGTPQGFPAGGGNFGQLIVFVADFGCTQMYLDGTNIYMRTNWNTLNQNPPKMSGVAWQRLAVSNVSAQA